MGALGAVIGPKLAEPEVALRLWYVRRELEDALQMLRELKETRNADNRTRSTDDEGRHA
jgi:hypothetical protein